VFKNNNRYKVRLRWLLMGGHGASFLRQYYRNCCVLLVHSSPLKTHCFPFDFLHLHLCIFSRQGFASTRQTGSLHYESHRFLQPAVADFAGLRALMGRLAFFSSALGTESCFCSSYRSFSRNSFKRVRISPRFSLLGGVLFWDQKVS